MGKKSGTYTLQSSVLAQLIAAHVSGFGDAIANDDDLDLAEEFIEIINEEYK